MVIKPDLLIVVVFGVQVTQIVSVKLPVVLFKEICVSASVTVQLVLELTRKNSFPPAAIKSRDAGEIFINPETPV